LPVAGRSSRLGLANIPAQISASALPGSPLIRHCIECYWSFPQEQRDAYDAETTIGALTRALQEAVDEVVVAAGGERPIRLDSMWLERARRACADIIKVHSRTY
jgi:hypothetical protein